MPNKSQNAHTFKSEKKTMRKTLNLWIKYTFRKLSLKILMFEFFFFVFTAWVFALIFTNVSLNEKSKCKKKMICIHSLVNTSRCEFSNFTKIHKFHLSCLSLPLPIEFCFFFSQIQDKIELWILFVSIFNVPCVTEKHYRSNCFFLLNVRIFVFENMETSWNPIEKKTFFLLQNSILHWPSTV